MCEIRGLSSRNDVVICHCLHCNMVFFWNKNVIINFEQKDFNAFKNIVKDIRFHESSIPFPDDTERVIVSTSDSSINLSFDINELNDVQEALEEASCMQEVYELIKT